MFLKTPEDMKRIHRDINLIRFLKLRKKKTTKTQKHKVISNQINLVLSGYFFFN